MTSGQTKDAFKKTRKKIKKGLSWLSLLALASLSAAAILVLIGLAKTAKQAQSLQYDGPGELLTAQQKVLGEDDERAEEQEEEIKKEEESKKEEQKKEEERQKESQKTESSSGSSNKSGATVGTSATITPVIQIKRQSEGNKQETEIETADGQKIKTKVEDDGTTKIEIEHGELKIKYEVRNGQVIQTVEDEDGNEAKLDESELEELKDEFEQELESDNMRIASNAAKPTIVRNNIAAVTEFPLSIDIGTNQLILTTPAGQKIVTVLPDQAIENLLATGIITRVSQSDQTNVEGFSNLSGLVELKVRNGEPVYEIEGIKQHKLFAFIPVDQPIKAVLSAETGKVLTTQQSFFTNLVDLLSP